MNVGNWLAKWSEATPHKTALIEYESGRKWSYAELDERANRVANMLRDQLGVSKGDRLAVLAANRIEQIELFFGVCKLGAILVPINWRLAPEEVAWILDQSESKLLFYDRDCSQTVDSLAGDSWKGACISMEGDGENAYPKRLKRAACAFVAADVSQDTPLMLLYTSGTTGRPKGAILTHGSITWNAVNTSVCWDLHHDDMTLTHTPLFHTGGWNVLTLPLLHHGAGVVLMSRFDPAAALDAVDRHRVSVMFAVPTMFQMMLEAENFARVDLSCVRFFISGGASCPLPLIAAYQKRRVVFKQGYGLTEVGPNCFVLHEKDAVTRAGSVGFAVLHLDSRIVDRAGHEVASGEVGELQLRGPTVCAGYWKNPKATKAAMDKDGWFATGDLFMKDQQGYHYVVGRLKEMYISGGENVYPAEIERVLYDFPGVVEAAVVGVPDQKWGEVGQAFIAIAGSGEAQDTEAGSILAFMRQRLARYKVPKQLSIMESLPKGSSGKILKTELHKLACERRSVPGSGSAS